MLGMGGSLLQDGDAQGVGFKTLGWCIQEAASRPMQAFLSLSVASPFCPFPQTTKAWALLILVSPWNGFPVLWAICFLCLE